MAVGLLFYNKGKADGAAQERREIIEALKTELRLSWTPGFNHGISYAIELIEQRSEQKEK